MYNGQPSLIARWFDELGITQGDRIIHVGCGSGYFTSLIAHIVGPAARVDAIEVDAELADRARTSLSDQPWVTVRHGDGSSGLPVDVNAIVVHAGATHVLDAWLDSLAENGRLLLPLTIEFEGMPSGIGKGLMLLVTRRGHDWSARVVGALPVAIYSLKVLRDRSIGATLAQAMMTGSLLKVARVRRERPTG